MCEFVNTEKELTSILDEIKKRDVKIRTREQVEHYSWKKIGSELIEIYHNIL